VAAVIPTGTVAWGIQLPIQSQSTRYAEPWEADAGTDELVAIAQAADRAGALYVAVCEHVAIPKPLDEKMSTSWYHTTTTLGFLAGVTRSVRLLSHVVVAAYHHPLQVAKAFATLDALSGGRAILGIGAGHVEGEFALLGVDFAGRGGALESALPAIRAALDNEYPALPDRGWGLDGSAGMRPRPVQVSLPVWVGGSSPAAVRRAAQLADGWLPQGTMPADLPGEVARIRRLRTDARLDPAFDVGANVFPVYVGDPGWDVGRYTITGKADEIADRLRLWTDAGVNQLQMRFRSRDAAELVDQLERFGTDVAPLVAAG
jgi:probable F420-dependent oxidoreductase